MSEPAPRIACGVSRAARLPKYVDVPCKWFGWSGPCEHRATWEVWLGGPLLDKIKFEHDPTFIDGRILVCGTHRKQIDNLWQKRWGRGNVCHRRKSTVPKNLEVIAHNIAELKDRLQKFESKQGRGPGAVFHPLRERAERVEEVERAV